MRPSRWNWLVVFALLVGSSGAVSAQTGTVTGKVTDKAGGRPVASANVQLLAAGGRSMAAAITNAQGVYRLTVVAGTYTLQVIGLGYQSVRVSGLAVAAGATVSRDVSIEARVVQLEAMTTTVSRQAEKTTDAPAQITVVPTVEITDRPALTVTDHVKNLPGVDASQGGLVQANVVGRGFNNIFSGALLMLIDNRFASVPSLRVNVPAFFTATDQDIEKVEFVLGPGAALYGPNSANGVLAITTKSPFESKGTTLVMESGFRSGSENAEGASLDDTQPFYRVGFRHASAGAKVGFKLSGEYLKGQDWLMRDPAEPTTITTPGVTCTEELGCRDFDIEKWNFDARFDYRPSEKTQLTVNGGWSNAGNLIEYTGIGAGQARDWGYKYAQARLRSGRLFVQGFANFSDAGDTYLFRSGNPIADQSRVWAAQAQHSFDIGSKQTFTYGLDYSYTDARTGGTINGRNEEIDNVTEVGGYLYSQTRLSPKLDLIAALRADDHSALEDLNWSPRAAIVFKPNQDQAVRFTYNRAFSTPSNNNLFLDIVAGSIPLGGGLKYDIRALGVPSTGFSFRGYCGAGGVDTLCMRTPFPVPPPLAGNAFPAQAAPLWPIAAGAVALRLPAALPPSLAPFAGDIIAALLGTPTPTPTQVTTQLRTLDPSKGVFNNVGTSAVADIPDLVPTISNVLEAGYKGTFGQKFRIELAGWYEQRENFVGPLIVESPNVFLDTPSTGAYLGATFAPALVQRLVAKGVPLQQAQAIAAGVTPTIAGAMGGLSGSSTAPGVPLGTVVPNSPLTQNSDMFLTYRNFGSVELWGSDVSATYLIGDRWSVAGAYSYVNKDFFTAAEVEGPTDVALNAPRHKGAFSVQYAEGATGFAAEVRGRFVTGFPVNSGVYTTALLPDGTRENINDYTTFDLTASYRFMWGLMASASIQNMFNNYYQTFAGLPYLGRLVSTRVTYTF